MSNVASINIWNYIFEMGNWFFDVKQQDIISYTNDLTYEQTDHKGLNGLMLNIEERSNEYRGEVSSFFGSLLNLISILFLRKKVKHKSIMREDKLKRSNITNAQAIIDYKVRKRLLTIINEDVDLWLSIEESKSIQKPKHGVIKNQFKTKIKEDKPKRLNNWIVHRLMKTISSIHEKTSIVFTKGQSTFKNELIL